MAPQTVSVGTCYSMTEALMIRSLLGARGIEAIIPGLGSGSSVLAYTSGFTSVVLVDHSHAEEAAALITQLREGQSAGEKASHDSDDEHDDEPPADAHEGSADGMDELLARRRRIVSTIGAAVLVPFGTGHLVNRAWARGAALAVMQGAALWYVAAGHRVGLVMAFVVLLLDLFGGAALARRGPELPAARSVARERRALAPEGEARRP